jgi:hypothetical protein
LFLVVPSAPSAPTIGTATAGAGQAVVSFSAPADDGGSPITSYTATSDPGGITATGSGPAIVVNGLAPGTTYTFTVTATNAIGTSAPSAPSNSITTPTVPGAPANVTATPGNGLAKVSFSVPASDGGSPIDYYTVTANPGAITADGVTSPIAIGGLSNGTSYTFTVTATNDVGTSDPSLPSNSVTPAVPPDSPANLVATATGSDVSITWTPVAGAVQYQVLRATAKAGPYQTVSGGVVTAPPAADSGLAGNSTYLYVVVAIGPTGVSSDASGFDYATTVVFEDPDLTGVHIKAQHLNQLILAVNAVRTAAGVGAHSYPVAIINQSAVGSSLLGYLRADLNEARSNLNLPPYQFTVDPTLTSGQTPIKGAHFTQLRDATK